MTIKFDINQKNDLSRDVFIPFSFEYKWNRLSLQLFSNHNRL